MRPSRSNLTCPARLTRPEDSELLYTLAMTYLNLESSRSAKATMAGLSELLRKELARNPKHAAAWHSLGETLSGLGKQAEAVEALKRAIWLNTRLSGSYILLAKIYVDQQRLGLAEDTVRRAIEVAP